MVLLIDTNVILDCLLERQPQFTYSDYVLAQCRTRRLKGFVAFHSISTIWYTLRKHPQLNRRKLLAEVTDMLTVTSASHAEVVNAIQNENFPDLEDCLQEKCALNVGADFIVTNNIKDFSASQVPAVTPKDFLEVIFDGKNLYAE